MSGGLARAGAISLVGAVTGAGVNFGIGVIVGRGLGADGTGTFFQIVAIFIILSNILELGADTGLVRFCSSAVATGRNGELRPLVRIAIVPVVGVGVVLTVLAWMLAPRLAGLLTASPDVPMVEIVRTLIPFVVLASLLAVVLGATRGLGSVATFTVLQNVALPAGRFMLIGGALLAGAGLVDVLRAWIAPLPIVVVIAVALLARQLARRTREQIDTDVEPTPVLRRRFWGFSSARAVSAAVEILLEWVDVIIVAAFLSPAEAGIYAVVSRSVRAGQVVQQAARVAVAPMVSAALARRDVLEARRLYIVVTRAMVLVSWPFYLMLACFAPGVLAIFGPGFAAGGNALTIMSLTMALAAAAGMVQTVLLMGGKSSWQLADKSTALAVNIGLNLLLVPMWGVVGAAVAWAVTVAVDTSLAAWQVHKGMGVHVPPASLMLPALLPVLVFGGGGLVLRVLLDDGWAGLAAMAVGGGLVYFGLCWALRRRLGLDTVVSSIRNRRGGALVS
ncbi:polysaccharide biosynthesis C-terminal domain-containing protein [Phytoactinopolyspora limicola]|uniref:oligosaccharide flippase family protein n=1 Tax=Phytoactinopolyspora limicola TaxID=2715536 RepID=UPI00140A649E|nr:polysaccharide biosynthesis C-terminal domain-containing protein [Phytoactinopolyspora limicola]